MTLMIKSIIDCTVRIEVAVVASAPMDVVLYYDITGPGSGSVSFSFTAGSLSQTQDLPTNGDGTVDGSASATAGGQSGGTRWTACVTTPPTTDL